MGSNASVALEIKIVFEFLLKKLSRVDGTKSQKNYGRSHTFGRYNVLISLSIWVKLGTAPQNVHWRNTALKLIVV